MKGLHKKIIIISTEFPPGPGGIGSHAYSLTEALSKKGWEMDVFTCGDYSSKQTIVDFDRKQSFKIHRFRRKGWLTYFYRLYDVAHYIRKQRGGGNCYRIRKILSLDRVMAQTSFFLQRPAYSRYPTRFRRELTRSFGKEIHPSFHDGLQPISRSISLYGIDYSRMDTEK